MSASSVSTCAWMMCLAMAMSGCASTGQGSTASAACHLESVRLGLPEGSLAIPGVHRLDGWATVSCSSTATRALTLEVALISARLQPVVLRPSGRDSAQGIEFDLFADEQLNLPIGDGEKVNPVTFWEVHLPAQSNSFVTIPFFGKVHVPAVMPPGLYGAPSGLSIYTRPKS